MATQAELFAAARKHMVDSQVRPNRVTDPRLLSAMRRLPRERFLPRSSWPMAYVDDDVPLGHGRYLMEPMVLARMLQAAALQDQERVLIVGAGTGYSAAVIASCGCRVTALEEEAALTAIANTVLPEIAPAVTLVAGPLRSGWSALAPYDMVLIEGAIPEIPVAIAEQLHRETGRLVTAICAPGQATHAIMAEMTIAGLGVTPLFDCATPPIPSLGKAPEFQF